MEMWKNFPLPPWGMALVKKNLWPSREKSGGSFCREKEKLLHVCQVATCLQGFCFCFLLIYLFRLRLMQQTLSVSFTTAAEGAAFSSCTCLCNQLSLSSSCFWKQQEISDEIRNEFKKRSDVDTQCIPEIQINICLLVMWSSSASHHNRTNSQTHDLISTRTIYLGGGNATKSAVQYFFKMRYCLKFTCGFVLFTHDKFAECVTLIQTPVVASHRVRIELFWPLFSQLTASLVLVAHFTMVM